MPLSPVETSQYADEKSRPDTKSTASSHTAAETATVMSKVTAQSAAVTARSSDESLDSKWDSKESEPAQGAFTDYSKAKSLLNRAMRKYKAKRVRRTSLAPTSDAANSAGSATDSRVSVDTEEWLDPVSGDAISDATARAHKLYVVRRLTQSEMLLLTRMASLRAVHQCCSRLGHVIFSL